MAQMRLDKFLGEMGVGSRSQIKEMTKKGRVLVNGETEKKSDRKIEPEQDEIQVDGKIVQYAQWEYYMLNKPQGVVSATEDGRYPTVVSLIKTAKRKDIFPVGRLDIDTEGLLLLTNNGDLAHRLLSPKKHVDKVYYAELEGKLPADSRERVERGLTLEDGSVTLPGRLEILEQGTLEQGTLEQETLEQETLEQETLEQEVLEQGTSLQKIRLTIQEGKYHQVKRMMEALGCRVVYLKRLSMGALLLDEQLKPGEYRALTEEEIRKLTE